jgi:hypothetical protein
MRQRCLDPEFHRFPAYGGAGISVCERWRNSFEAFLADMGPRPTPRHNSIDRIDNRKGYEPENCRWATPKIQNSNKRNVVLYEHQGEKLHLKDWATRASVRYETLRYRVLNLGWPLEKALATPVGKQKPGNSSELPGWGAKFL